MNIKVAAFTVSEKSNYIEQTDFILSISILQLLWIIFSVGQLEIQSKRGTY